jgi:hypothetical protein
MLPPHLLLHSDFGSFSSSVVQPMALNFPAGAAGHGVLPPRVWERRGRCIEVCVSYTVCIHSRAVNHVDLCGSHQSQCDGSQTLASRAFQPAVQTCHHPELLACTRNRAVVSHAACCCLACLPGASMPCGSWSQLRAGLTLQLAYWQCRPSWQLATCSRLRWRQQVGAGQCRLCFGNSVYTK